MHIRGNGLNRVIEKNKFYKIMREEWRRTAVTLTLAFSFLTSDILPSYSTRKGAQNPPKESFKTVLSVRRLGNSRLNGYFHNLCGGGARGNYPKRVEDDILRPMEGRADQNINSEEIKEAE